MMYKTKMVKVYLPGWRLGFSLIVNFLFLIMQPFRALANYDEIIALKLAQADRPQAANPAVSPTALEPEILAEINRVRTNPQGYAQWLEEQQQYYDGIWLRLPGEKPVRTNKGRKALSEAIAVLKAQQPLPPLSVAEGTAATATSKLENFATANNIQYISYGRVTAKGIVMGLVVDELFPDRRRRNSLLDPEAENTGVVCKPDPRYARVCAIAYSDTATTTEIAEANNTPQQTATAPPDLEVSDVEADEATTDTAPTAPTAPQDNTSVAESLPVPPPPQAPPVLPPPNEPEEVEVREEEDPDIRQAEAEIAELELETESPETTESTVDNEDTEVTEAEESEVAVDSDSSRLLERVERGSLAEGDRIISDDGSFYDSYPLEGKAGESFSIYLESDEFDSFVALVDAQGNIVQQNDDISQEDSNSRIRVNLPEDGVYNIIVNTYDEGGTGNYVLTVSR